MRENIFKHSLFALFSVLHFVFFVHAQNDHSGFISIACGLPKSIGSYIESTTGLNFVSDEPFVKTGVSEKIPPESQNNYLQQLLRLRAFPEGIRNCYTIDVLNGTRYLIRTRFYYGNYDGKSNPPEFDLHIGANYWATTKFLIDSPIYKEIIHVAAQNYVHVCVVNVGKGTPLISAIELRPLTDNIYVTDSGSLALESRVDLGSTSNISYRYPSDTFDRSWFYLDVNNMLFQANWTTVETSSAVNPGVNYKIPTGIMSTAIGPANPDNPLTYSWYTFDEDNAYYVYLHFAEIEELNANESRSFDIFVNGELFYGPLVPERLKLNTIYSKTNLPIVAKTLGNYTISMVKNENSTLPPILNAIEIYTSLDLSQSDTDQDDFDAITMIKSIYGVKRNWDGDPCAPVLYKWTGLTCSYEDSGPPRITALNLSSSELTGEITSQIFNLSKLETLDLSNNSLTGPVPPFLAQLQNLKVLHLEKNNFTGSIPAELIEKSKSGSLSLSFDTATTVGEDTNQCASGECNRKKKKKTVMVPLVSSVGGLFLILVVAAAILLGLRKRRKPVVTPPSFAARVNNAESEAQNGLQQRYTYSEVQKMTNEFKKELGKGGFGTVYLGFVGSTRVAVKKLSASSAQGYREFQAEVKLLVTVHHTNLTSLVGYCMEGTNMALIYEYMTNGDLHSHLLGDRSATVLGWAQRLKIALDSAKGLEYLHNGCKPPIVHRDIKTTNILLTENFQGKLADFGLSRSFPIDDASCVFTVVAGTPGYLDPEYSTTSRLNEKSDVYSFGVVLLQIITSRSAILVRGNERTHLSQWVSSMLGNGDINGIVDQRLRGDFNTNSAWKAVEIAMSCVSPQSIKRPGMSNVVSELKQCLEIGSTNSNQMFSMKMPSQINPSAR